MNINKLKVCEKINKIIEINDKYIVPFLFAVGSLMIVGCGITLIFNELLLYRALNVGVFGYILLCVGAGSNYLLEDVKKYLDKKMNKYKIRDNMPEDIDRMDLDYQKIQSKGNYKFNHEPNHEKIIQYDNKYKYTKKYHR